jgi:hypothetical protein
MELSGQLRSFAEAFAEAYNAYWDKLGCVPGCLLMGFMGLILFMVLGSLIPDGWGARCAVATGPLNTKCLVWKRTDKCLTWYGAEKPCPPDY